MLYKATDVLGLPIASIEEKEIVGKVTKIIIEKKDASILGFVVYKDNFIFGKKMYISEVDILDIDKNGITTRTKENITDLSQVLRVKKIVKNKFDLMSLPAYTRSKRYIGKIVDYVIDNGTLNVVKFYVGNFFDHRIIDQKKVYQIKNDRIIFKDNFEKIGTRKSVGNSFATN